MEGGNGSGEVIVEAGGRGGLHELRHRGLMLMYLRRFVLKCGAQGNISLDISIMAESAKLNVSRTLRS